MQDYPNTIPNEYRPLSAILFAIPLVGFIMLIVFAFDSSNINRRNYARSFFCAYLVAIIILIVVLILALVLGISLNSISNY